jgi:hypothetical protein
MKHHRLTPKALIVGCLPSFVIFIRGRVTASQVQFFDTSPNMPSKPSFHSQSSQTTAHGRTEDVVLDEEDIERVVQSRDDRSSKSLIDENVATQGWSQKWNRGIAFNTDSEGSEKLGQRDDV